MDIQQELRALVVALNSESIEYALCGGLAVAFHGYARFTKDIDILIAKESLENALKVSEGVGFLDSSGRIPFPNLDLYRVLKTEGTEYLMLDWMVIATKDNAIWAEKTWFDWEGIPICVVSVEGLVTMKRRAGRDQEMTQRKIEVDMSSKAIDARLRDVAQLRRLGLSIAKAKPIAAPESTSPSASCPADHSASQKDNIHARP